MKEETTKNQTAEAQENQTAEAQENKTTETQENIASEAQTKQQTEAPAEPTAEEKLSELQDKYLRLMAEYDNYRKRTVREKTELLLGGGQGAVKAILPVLDDFERALAGNTSDAEAMYEGVTLIFSKFNKALEQLGVKRMETTGADFDTDMHEAVAMVPAPSDDLKGKVVDCIQTGYTMNDKVIRCAKVAVGQ